MTITIDLNNLGRAISDLENYKNQLIAKNEQFVSKLSELGQRVATENFDKAEYDGNRDVEVTTGGLQKHNDEVSTEVIANGDTVAFIEYGAGVYQPNTHPNNPFERGTYGKGYGKRKSWGYYDEIGDLHITQGNPSNNCMYEMTKTLKDQSREIAKEVFGNG